MRELVVGCLAVAWLSACRAAPESADLILTNGRVHTLRWEIHPRPRRHAGSKCAVRQRNGLGDRCGGGRHTGWAGSDM